jgi:hypothetical protein
MLTQQKKINKKTQKKRHNKQQIVMMIAMPMRKMHINFQATKKEVDLVYI